MKKKIIYSILAIIVVVGIWVVLNKEKATQMVVDLGMAMTSSVKHRNPSTEKAKFEMTADAFTKAFKDNAAEANKQYINQAVLIEGDITTISGVTITLNNIACNIDSTEAGKIKELKVGSKVKVQGLVVGYNDLMEEIALAQCTIK
jgi:tRNA_anti-like